MARVATYGAGYYLKCPYCGLSESFYEQVVENAGMDAYFEHECIQCRNEYAVEVEWQAFLTGLPLEQ